MHVNIKLLYENSIIPKYATIGSAGLDCVAHSIEYDSYTGIYTYGLGFALEIPIGYVGLLFPRSSSANRGNLMANCVGVIDSDYRGEVSAKFIGNVNPYKIGEKIAQLIIIKYPNIEFNEVNELNSTERGAGGYGSTDAIAATV